MTLKPMGTMIRERRKRSLKRLRSFVLLKAPRILIAREIKLLQSLAIQELQEKLRKGKGQD